MRQNYKKKDIALYFPPIFLVLIKKDVKFVGKKQDERGFKL
ncbi:hypothetical protein EVA_01420 [gut metagenome]|uniref:Uncharacterized protein n=1 Tax=gut metagenome TaxID=749906 RepID=J9GPZ9_9ZZZZ